MQTTTRLRWVHGLLETCVYLLVVLCVVSRGYHPDLAHAPLVAVVALLTLVPPLVMPSRRNALVLGRLSLAVAIGLLVQERMPIPIDALTWVSPREETLTVSISGILVAVMGVGLLLLWRLGGLASESEGGELAGVVAVTTVLLLAFAIAMWVLINRVMVATTEPEGRFYSDTLGALSITLEYGIVTVYALTVTPLSRLRRLAVVAAAALILRAFLPPSGGV